jgi:exodeoxyribonuclease VII small subunit
MAKASSQADSDRFDDVDAMSFEEALAALEDIVRRLEEGDIDLDGAIEAYARGAALKRHCEGKLSQAEQRISRIAVGADGSLSAVSENDETNA